MATKASAEKAARRSAKRSTKQRRTPQESKAAAESDRDQQSREPGSRSSALNSVPTLAERVQAQREQLFKAMAIVECCKYASATLYEVDDSEYMVPAFDTVCDLLDTSAGELERIASECGD